MSNILVNPEKWVDWAMGGLVGAAITYVIVKANTFFRKQVDLNTRRMDIVNDAGFKLANRCFDHPELAAVLAVEFLGGCLAYFLLMMIVVTAFIFPLPATSFPALAGGVFWRGMSMWYIYMGARLFPSLMMRYVALRNVSHWHVKAVKKEMLKELEQSKTNETKPDEPPAS